MPTHLHLDHVEGLRFFAPFWRADTELHIWGPPSPVASRACLSKRARNENALPRSHRRDVLQKGVVRGGGVPAGHARKSGSS